MADVFIENLIPVHPQCRCIALPVDITPKPVDITRKPEEVKPAPEIVKDKVAKRMHPRYRGPYMEEKQKALDFFNSLSSEEMHIFKNYEESILTERREAVREKVVDYIGENMPVIYREDPFPPKTLESLLASWQEDTRTPLASALKEMAVKVEGASLSPSCIYSEQMLESALDR